MKVNDPNLSSLAATEAARTQAAAKTSSARTQGTPEAGGSSGDDVHLSELVRSLRSLATESPERQQHLEQIARTYAKGNYQVDSQAVAGKIIDDALGQV